MPSFRDLNCSIEVGKYDTKLQEYNTFYSDREVSTFVVVPDKPTTFSIHLISEAYVAEGLIALVWIDGVYQGNKVGTGLRPPTKSSPPGRSANIRIRQKCVPNGKGGQFLGSQWMFDRLTIGTVENGANLREQVKLDLGRIDVIVLRCMPTTYGVRSQMDGEKPNPAPTKSKNKENGKDTTSAPVKAVGKAQSKKGSDKGSSVGGLFGLFDGAADDMDYAFRFPARSNVDGHYSTHHRRHNRDLRRPPSPPTIVADESDDEVAQSREALYRAELKRRQRRHEHEKKYSITHKDLVEALDEARRRGRHEQVSAMYPGPYQAGLMPPHQAAMVPPQTTYGYPHPYFPAAQPQWPNIPLARSPAPEHVPSQVPGAWHGQAQGWQDNVNQQPASATNPASGVHQSTQAHNAKTEQPNAAVKDTVRFGSTAGQNDQAWTQSAGQNDAGWGSTSNSKKRQDPSWDSNPTQPAKDDNQNAGWGNADDTAGWTDDKKDSNSAQKESNEAQHLSGGGANTGNDANSWNAEANGNDNWNVNDSANGKVSGAWGDAGNNAQDWSADKTSGAKQDSSTEVDNHASRDKKVDGDAWTTAGIQENNDKSWDNQPPASQKANDQPFSNKAPASHHEKKDRIRKHRNHRDSDSGAATKHAENAQAAPVYSWDFNTSHYEAMLSKKHRKAAVRPALTVPEETQAVKDHHADMYVAAADVADYVHKVRRLDYIDTKQRPYAVFRFYYRTRTAMEKLIPGIDLTERQDEAEVRKVLGRMSKAELERELLKLKGVEVSSGSSEDSESDSDSESSGSADQPAAGTQAPAAGGGNDAGWGGDDGAWADAGKAANDHNGKTSGEAGWDTAAGW